jgi:hypothetical protein
LGEPNQPQREQDASREPPHPSRSVTQRKPAGGSDAAVAMLEFLARAAGTSGITRRPGPRRADSCRGPLPCPLPPAIRMAVAAPLPPAPAAGRH